MVAASPHAELSVQQELFPAEAAVFFGSEQAETAASLYRSVSKPRGREVGRTARNTARPR